MAVKLMTNIYRWNMMSSDMWPSSGVPEGSTVHIIDTGEEYIYHNSMWEDDLRNRNVLNEI
jgi:hypothetical protein